MSLIICLTIALLFGGVWKVLASDLPNCPPSGYFHNFFGTYSRYDGDKYVGDWKDDKKHGQGTYAYASGRKYIGKFKEGKLNGLQSIFLLLEALLKKAFGKMMGILGNNFR